VSIILFLGFFLFSCVICTHFFRLKYDSSMCICPPFFFLSPPRSVTVSILTLFHGHRPSLSLSPTSLSTHRTLHHRPTLLYSSITDQHHHRPQPFSTTLSSPEHCHHHLSPPPSHIWKSNPTTSPPYLFDPPPIKKIR